MQAAMALVAVVHGDALRVPIRRVGLYPRWSEGSRNLSRRQVGRGPEVTSLQRGGNIAHLGHPCRRYANVAPASGLHASSSPR